MSSVPGLPRDWIPTLTRFLDRESTVARVVVTDARGSTPREPGAFMLVGPDGVEGSIGGGRLEWEAIAAARTLLADPDIPARVNKVVLAADVGQCCGGVVSVWLEKFTRADLPVLRAAADAGARGRAVLVSEVTGGGIRRRVVRLETHSLARSALPPEPHPGAQSAMVDAATGYFAAVAGSLPQEPPLRTQTAAAAAISVDAGSAVDQLLRQPRQHALPIVLQAPAGATATASANLTFIERLDDNLPAVWLYGAGHVGQALARILMELPLRLTWIDSRAGLFPNTLPEGVRVLRDADSVATTFDAPVGAYFVVMSHSHSLDFELCHALLERNDFTWLGLIGSDSKAARFRSRLARTGLSRDVIEKMACPIGVEGITSKWPAAIAVAVAAQLMQKISAAAECVEVLSSSVALPPHSALPRTPQNQAGAALESAVTATPAASTDTPCAPELCATCGSSVTAPADPALIPNPGHETVTS
jgi:xanthine dehydrogenase accessory factor